MQQKIFLSQSGLRVGSKRRSRNDNQMMTNFLHFCLKTDFKVVNFSSRDEFLQKGISDHLLYIK